MAIFNFGLGRPKKNGGIRLGPIQKAILLDINRNKLGAYSVAIASRLRSSGVNVANAQVYVALRRMETKGLVTERKNNVEDGNKTDSKKMNELSRRGRPHLLFKLTQLGRRAILNNNADVETSSVTETSFEGEADVSEPDKNPSFG